MDLTQLLPNLRMFKAQPSRAEIQIILEPLSINARSFEEYKRPAPQPLRWLLDPQKWLTLSIVYIASNELNLLVTIDPPKSILLAWSRK